MQLPGDEVKDVATTLNQLYHKPFHWQAADKALRSNPFEGYVVCFACRNTRQYEQMQQALQRLQVTWPSDVVERSFVKLLNRYTNDPEVKRLEALPLEEYVRRWLSLARRLGVQPPRRKGWVFKFEGRTAPDDFNTTYFGSARVRPDGRVKVDSERGSCEGMLRASLLSTIRPALEEHGEWVTVIY